MDKTQTLDFLNGMKEELLKIVKELYENPEEGDREFLASELHIRFLERHGFSVERDVCGRKTGYVARYKGGKPGPHIAFLAEYDALPEIGHGCGHNMLGATSLAAGAALKNMVSTAGGSVSVFGTPAEETKGAKVDYAREGLFDHVDAAMIAHPGNRFARSGDTLALEPVQFEFFGKSAHAAAAPEQGINALDAAISMINSINALREHMKSSARIHGVIINGGEAANIVPAYTKVQYYVRAATRSYLDELTERVKKCAEGAALATGTTVKMTRFEYSYDNLLTNQRLSQVFTDQFKEVAGIEFGEPMASTGSSDLGNVSLICPAIQPYYDITNDLSVAAHTKEMAEATLTDYAGDTMILTAAAMALTGLKIIEDPRLLDEIREEFGRAEK